MSLNVLVVPENPTYNGSILKPVCESLLTACDKPRAAIEIMSRPHTNGYEHARRLLPETILELYQHKDIILFIPDSDGLDRTAEFDRLETDFTEAAIVMAKSIRLFCCAAVPEVEAWLLAGHSDKWEPSWKWSAMRTDRSIKENYFQPFLQRHGQDKLSFPDEGRRALMREALKNYGGIKRRCPELQILEDRIREHLALAT